MDGFKPGQIYNSCMPPEQDDNKKRELEFLHEQKKEIKKRIKILEKSLKNDRKKQITLETFKTLVYNPKNWNYYSYDHSENEAYNVCDMYGGCCSSNSAISPALYCFDSIISPKELYDERDLLIRCHLCLDDDKTHKKYMDDLFEEVLDDELEGETIFIDPQQINTKI